MSDYLHDLMYGPELPGVICLLGNPVVGNPTQFMIEEAFRASAAAGRYVTFQVDEGDLEAAVKGIRAMKFRGANVTVPYKISVMKYLDELTESAMKIGAVNCIYNRNGKLIGDNTDGQGFVESLKTVTPIEGKKAAVLGAGGAARAIAVELALAGVEKIIIINRSGKKAEMLAADVRDLDVSSEYREWNGLFELPEGIDLFVNATSIGLNDYDAEMDISWSSVPETCMVADVVFNPVNTGFLRNAKDRGCIVIDGLGMLVNQGAIAFKEWSGFEADKTVMRKALDKAFSIK